ncbi:class I SAM-dependent methyltransferase [Natrinema versiforme]|uniref:S-adenosylmethionine-dependent methyltransferase 3 n=1 Tax=Natrinema versiforme JCM 10478 TaxID=1227496 RepID=L9Y172_9EURY|nr:class I SAM-dependent methyltransferase [Natrinema versiforme]ELY67457.1 S-adenosylmethionine-dependent methyltransferase 3 [Natrinema versiforme JCM 10478]
MERFENTRQPDWDWWGKLWPAPGETLRELGLESGDTVAEIGSGNGYFALPAARITAPASVYALDIDESLLEALSHLADQQAIENLTTVTGDARELARHLPEPVDVVLIANTFHGIDEPATVVQQTFDSLRPGGRFIVINWKDRPRESTRIAGEPRGPPTELRTAPEATERTVLDAAGFTLEDTIELPPYHYALVFER